MRKGLVSIALASVLCIGISSAATYASVDGEKITDKDLEFFKQVIPGFDFAKLSPQDKQMAIGQLIERKLALLAAQKDGIEKSKEYKDALETIKSNLAVDLWARSKQKKLAESIKIKEEDLKKFYNENKNAFIDQQAQVRQIVVSSEDEAKKIIDTLKKQKGEKLKSLFIKLANEKSIDQSTKKSQNGGDLGNVNRNQMLPQFTEVVFALKPNSVTSDPIKTEFGYHIIFLQSKTDAKTTSFEEAKSSIENNLKMQAVDNGIKQEMAKLREKAKIVIEPIK